MTTPPGRYNIHVKGDGSQELIPAVQGGGSQAQRTTIKSMQNNQATFTAYITQARLAIAITTVNTPQAIPTLAAGTTIVLVTTDDASNVLQVPSITAADLSRRLFIYNEGPEQLRIEPPGGTAFNGQPVWFLDVGQGAWMQPFSATKWAVANEAPIVGLGSDTSSDEDALTAAPVAYLTAEFTLTTALTVEISASGSIVLQDPINTDPISVSYHLEVDGAPVTGSFRTIAVSPDVGAVLTVATGGLFTGAAGAHSATLVAQATFEIGGSAQWHMDRHMTVRRW